MILNVENLTHGLVTVQSLIMYRSACLQASISAWSARMAKEKVRS